LGAGLTAGDGELSAASGAGEDASESDIGEGGAGPEGSGGKLGFRGAGKSWWLLWETEREGRGDLKLK
jgi:hypothetical protein